MDGRLARVLWLVAMPRLFVPFRDANTCPAYTDTVRRSHIRNRNRELEASLAKIAGAGDALLPASEEEKEAIKRR